MPLPAALPPPPAPAAALSDTRAGPRAERPDKEHPAEWRPGTVDLRLDAGVQGLQASPLSLGTSFVSWMGGGGGVELGVAKDAGFGLGLGVEGAWHTAPLLLALGASTLEEEFPQGEWSLSAQHRLFLGRVGVHPDLYALSEGARGEGLDLYVAALFGYHVTQFGAQYEGPEGAGVLDISARGGVGGAAAGVARVRPSGLRLGGELRYLAGGVGEVSRVTETEPDAFTESVSGVIYNEALDPDQALPRGFGWSVTLGLRL